MKLGMLDFFEDLSGFLRAHRIVHVDMKLGLLDYSEDLSGCIRDTPPHPNLTGLINAYAD